MTNEEAALINRIMGYVGFGQPYLWYENGEGQKLYFTIITRLTDKLSEALFDASRINQSVKPLNKHLETFLREMAYFQPAPFLFWHATQAVIELHVGCKAGAVSETEAKRLIARINQEYWVTPIEFA